MWLEVKLPASRMELEAYGGKEKEDKGKYRATAQEMVVPFTEVKTAGRKPLGRKYPQCMHCVLDILSLRRCKGGSWAYGSGPGDTVWELSARQW